MCDLLESLRALMVCMTFGVRFIEWCTRFEMLANASEHRIPRVIALYRRLSGLRRFGDVLLCIRTLLNEILRRSPLYRRLSGLRLDRW